MRLKTTRASLIVERARPLYAAFHPDITRDIDSLLIALDDFSQRREIKNQIKVMDDIFSELEFALAEAHKRRGDMKELVNLNQQIDEWEKRFPQLRWSNV